MRVATKSRSENLPWREHAERLIERIPGVVSAVVEGPQWAVTEVRVWYEPTWPVGDVVEDVHACLEKEAKARLVTARLRAVVAQPDRRAQQRARPKAIPVDAACSSKWPTGGVKLLGHETARVQSGVVGVHVWIEVRGRTFSGAAIGPDSPQGSLYTPALATLRALHSSLQVLHAGARPPGLVLERVVQVTVGQVPVTVVALTASEEARARSLTAAWANDRDEHLAVILALLQATSRTVNRWTAGEEEISRGRPRTIRHHAVAGTAERPPQRLSLVDFDVAEGPSGSLDVGVRLAGFGEAVDRRKRGERGSTEQLSLGASVTLDAVRDLLTIGGWRDGEDGNLRDAGAHRLRTGDQDIVVVLAEASVGGETVPLAGATSADDGIARASITAALQATNPLVASHSSTWSPQ